MRLFLAVFPPEDAQVQALRVIESLRSSGDGVSWVKRENLHYTLRFLGELGQDGARRAGEAAHEAAATLAPFEAVLTGAGAFPDAARARVLWLGMSAGAEPLRALAGALARSLRLRGFDRADKPFAPHLTIGRVRTPGDWTAKLAAARAPDVRFRVETLLLVNSTLGPGGSRYEVIEDAPLFGPG